MLSRIDIFVFNYKSTVSAIKRNINPIDYYYYVHLFIYDGLMTQVRNTILAGRKFILASSANDRLWLFLIYLYITV